MDPYFFDLPLLQIYVGLTMLYLGPLLFHFLRVLEVSVGFFRPYKIFPRRHHWYRSDDIKPPKKQQQQQQQQLCLHFSVLDTMYRWNIHHPNLVGIGSWGAGMRYFFPYPFLDLELFYLFLYFTLKIYENLLFFSNEDVRRIEPQTNNHKPNYRTTRPARHELPDLRF